MVMLKFIFVQLVIALADSFLLWPIEWPMTKYRDLETRDFFYTWNSTLDTLELRFTTRYRHFDLELKPKRDLFTDDLTANVYGWNTVEKIDIGDNHFFEGRDITKPGSWAILYINKGHIIGSIFYDEETYHIEPANFHPRCNRKLHPIIYSVKAYIIQLGQPIPEEIITGRTDPMPRDPINPIRFNPQRPICRVKLVSRPTLYPFFNPTNTAAYMALAIATANRAFSYSLFNNKTNVLSDVRLAVADIAILSTCSEDRNSSKICEDTDDLATLLGQFRGGAKGFCAGLLFNHEPMKDKSEMGMAIRGGICTERENIAVVTTLNDKHDGLNNMFTMHHTVLHELGVLFGAEHDHTEFYDRLDCNPEADDGGPFVMDYNSVAGLKNYWRFSPCTIKTVYNTINHQGGCFSTAEKLQSKEVTPNFEGLSEDCKLCKGSKRVVVTPLVILSLVGMILNNEGPNFDW